MVKPEVVSGCALSCVFCFGIRVLASRAQNNADVEGVSQTAGKLAHGPVDTGDPSQDLIFWRELWRDRGVGFFIVIRDVVIVRRLGIVNLVIALLVTVFISYGLLTIV